VTALTKLESGKLQKLKSVQRVILFVLQSKREAAPTTTASAPQMTVKDLAARLSKQRKQNKQEQANDSVPGKS